MELIETRRKRLISLDDSETSTKKMAERSRSKREEKNSNKSSDNLNGTFRIDDETQVQDASPKFKKRSKQRVKRNKKEKELSSENVHTTPNKRSSRKRTRILGDMQNMSGVMVVSSTDTPDRQLTNKPSVNFKEIPKTPANKVSLSKLRAQTPHQKSNLFTKEFDEEVTFSNKTSRDKYESNELVSFRKKPNLHSTPIPIKNDTTSVLQAEIVSPVRRRTFEIDEPVMPENKRKSELFERRVLKRKREHLHENSPMRKMSKSVAFDSIGKIESPWKDVLNASIADDVKLDLKPATIGENGFLEVLPPGPCKSTGSKTPLITRFDFEKNPAKSSTKKLTTSQHKISARKTKSAVKLPNYAAIHKNAFDRMESVADHAQRKADRAKALMSGCKVKIGLDISRDANSRKQLQFAATIGNTPTKKIAVQSNLQDNTTQKEMGNVLKVEQREIKVKSPLKQKLKGATNKSTLKEIKNVEIKAVANKVRAGKKDQIEIRRTEIKGVRSNRRFDLLMKMRQNK